MVNKVQSLESRKCPNCPELLKQIDNMHQHHKQQTRPHFSHIDFDNYRLALEEYNLERERFLLLAEKQDTDIGDDRRPKTPPLARSVRLGGSPKSEDSNPPCPSKLLASAYSTADHPLRASHLVRSKTPENEIMTQSCKLF